MRRFKGKDTMNTLLNIDNVFGEYEGRIGPLLIVIVLAAAPLLVWLLFLHNTFIKFTWVVIFDVVWGGIWALQILGNGKKRMAEYLEAREGQYQIIDKLVNINYIHEDGLIEYSNGKVGLLISGYPRTYLNDKAFANALKAFMDELDAWDWDLYMHNTIDEVPLSKELPKLVRYTDKQVIEERIEFYNYQDTYAEEHTSLYRYSFLVKASRTDWKTLRLHLGELVQSEVALCFNEIAICDKATVNDLCNRDVCGFIDLNKMLLSKYDNANFYGSKVLYYDNDIPEELRQDKEISNLSERRVSS